RLGDSAFLVLVAGGVGSILRLALGAPPGVRQNNWFGHSTPVVSPPGTSLPEVVVAVGPLIVFATVLLPWLPARALLPPDTYAWNQPRLLVLPVATLVIVIVPYIHRMMRAAMIESLESEYVEMARLKGVPAWRVTLVHALPNAIAPTIQVIGLNFLY